MSAPLRASRDAVLVAVQAVPGAKREGVVALHGERLRVRVAAAPEGGAANRAIAALLAALFGVRPGDVELAAGPTSRRKDFAVRGIALEEARRRLDAALSG